MIDDNQINKNKPSIMNKVDKITSESLNEINDEIKKKLAEVEKKFGVKIELGNTRYTDKNYRTKMKVSTVSENGKVRSKEAIAFERQVNLGNIDEKFEVGKRVRTRKGDVFIIDGYNKRATKYPVQLHNRDGRVKMPVGMLNNCEVVEY